MTAVTLAPAPAPAPAADKAADKAAAKAADTAALRAAAAEHARGDYQMSLLFGRARWSGADLAGTARRYGGRYAASRLNLFARLRAAGIDATVERVKTRSGRWAVALCIDGLPVSAVP